MTPQTAAIIYDFDGTLARGNIQERSFIPDVGLSREAFWAEVDSRARHHDADPILVYMHLMLEMAAAHGTRVTAAMLREHGRNADLYPGLADQGWFQRINCHAESCGLALSHFIVSSGIHEMILGSPVAAPTRGVFASKFIYQGETAVWPGVAINYTTKTQYLFRINKGILNHWDKDTINAFMPKDQRAVAFENMIFIGDGETDIPSMKMLTSKGGHSIAVYDTNREPAGLSRIHTLLSDGRVDFVAPADYTETSHLEIIVKGILGRMVRARPPTSLRQAT